MKSRNFVETVSDRVDFLEAYYNQLVDQGIVAPEIALTLLGVTLLLLVIQLCYYIGIYGRIPSYRNNRGIDPKTVPPPISVVVVVHENCYYFIEHTLPLLLNQQYHQFEVVVVDCSYDEEIGQLLDREAMNHSHLRLTRITEQPNFRHGIKLAITIGIKAASYEQLLFTTADSYPTSDRWLSLMAKGFIGGNVVIGYCGVEVKKGFSNHLIRCIRLATSIRYLSAAIRRHPYRGISHNIGYTRSLYFAHKGFNYLGMNVGDDDLFIQMIATPTNVSVIMNPHATMRQVQYGGLRWWHSMRKTFTYAFRHYPLGTRAGISFELWSRAIFFLVAIASIVLLPPWWKIIPAFLVLLRLMIVELEVWRIGRRLGERKLMGTYLLYDLISPLSECFLSLSRRLRPNRAIWK